MIDHLLRDLQVLQKADFLIGRIWLNVLVRRLGFFAFAALIAVFGLSMANVAGFYAFQASLGSVWAAAIVAAVDLVIAAIVLLVGSNSRPGPEIDVAFDVRKRWRHWVSTPKWWRGASRRRFSRPGARVRSV